MQPLYRTLGRSSRQTGYEMRRIFLLFVLLLAACAAQQTTPVALSQPGDTTLSCEQIAVEITRNEAEAIRFAGADEDVVSGNIAAGVVGTIFWPALLATDLSNADQIQLRALRDRNANLARIREDRGC